MLLFSLFLIALQAALLRYIGGGVFHLVLALPCVIYLGLYASNIEGAIGAVLIGYFMDLSSGGPKGMMAFLAVLLFVIGRMVGTALHIRDRGAVVFLSSILIFSFGLEALILTRLISPPEVAPSVSLIPRVLVESVLTGLLSPAIFKLMTWIDRSFTKEDSNLLR